MKPKDIFPKKAYWCDCLTETIVRLSKKLYSLKDIFDKINEIKGPEIYCVLRGENNEEVIFSCCGHIPKSNFVFNDDDDGTSYCIFYLEEYLLENYYKFNQSVFKN